MISLVRNISLVCISTLTILFSTLTFAQVTVEDNSVGQTSSTWDTLPRETYPINTLEEVAASESGDEIIQDDGYHFGVWVNYQQQFGALDGKFITVGGPSFGFNLGRHFFIGAGVYSTFGNVNLNTDKDHSFVYGGGIVGFRWNPQHPVVFRTQVLVGAIGFDTLSKSVPGMVESRTTSVIVVPEVALDIRLVGYLYLSLSANYRYVEKLPNEWSAMQGLGALSGNVSLGLSF